MPELRIFWVELPNFEHKERRSGENLEQRKEMLNCWGGRHSTAVVFKLWHPGLNLSISKKIFLDVAELNDSKGSALKA